MTNDLENSLCAALDALPASRTPAQTIGERLGINAAQIGSHTRRTRRRSFMDGQGQTNAAAIITRLPKNAESFHFTMDGTFRMSDALAVIQQHIGKPCSLTICTLGLNADTTDLLAAMVMDGRLTKLRLAISSYFRASDPQTAENAIAKLKPLGAEIAAERMHAKIQLWKPAKSLARYIVETSSNLRSCNCVEIATITNDHRLFDFHDKWLTHFFKKHPIQ